MSVGEYNLWELFSSTDNELGKDILQFCRLWNKDYSSADISFIFVPTTTGNITEWNFVDTVFITKSNFEFNNIMSYRRKIERANMMQHSDVYGTYIFNDGVTASTREVSVYNRDIMCGLFDKPKLNCDCTQYEVDAESTGVK